MPSSNENNQAPSGQTKPPRPEETTVNITIVSKKGVTGITEAISQAGLPALRDGDKITARIEYHQGASGQPTNIEVEETTVKITLVTKQGVKGITEGIARAGLPALRDGDKITARIEYHRADPGTVAALTQNGFSGLQLAFAKTKADIERSLAAMDALKPTIGAEEKAALVGEKQEAPNHLVPTGTANPAQVKQSNQDVAKEPTPTTPEPHTTSNFSVASPILGTQTAAVSRLVLPEGIRKRFRFESESSDEDEPPSSWKKRRALS